MPAETSLPSGHEAATPAKRAETRERKGATT